MSKLSWIEAEPRVGVRDDNGHLLEAQRHDLLPRPLVSVHVLLDERNTVLVQVPRRRGASVAVVLGVDSRHVSPV